MDANGRRILRVFSLSLLFCWRPRRDLNPCYRRERAVSWAGLDDGDAVVGLVEPTHS